VALAAFSFSYLGNNGGIADARALAFCVMVYAQLFLALSARSPTLIWGQLGYLSNPMLLLAIVASGLLQLAVILLPILHPVFEMTAYPLRHWLLIAVLALTPVTLIELAKLARAYLLSTRGRL
jgi:Ca2+-transporting ATPase